MDGILPFAGLLEELRRKGFAISPADYLRLNRLVGALGIECRTWNGLQNVLCPILAKSAEEQQAFHPIYRAWVDGIGGKMPFPTLAFENPASSELANESTPPEKLTWWRTELPSLAAGLAVLCLAIWFGGQVARQPDLPPAKPTQTITQKSEPVFEQLPWIEYIRTETREVQPEPPWMGWWRQHRFWLWGGGLGLLALYGWSQVWRWRHRPLIVQRAKVRGQPFRRALLRPPPHTSAVAGDARFREAARRLRQREPDGPEKLDLEASLRATVAQAGEVQLLFRPTQREPEYLVLLDRRGGQDHQSQIYEQLLRELALRGVRVVVYWYRGDPRFCRDARQQRPIPFTDLRRRYSRARLVLIGDGAGMLEPFTGHLAAWFQPEFESWTKRALLTPRVENEWGFDEIELSGSFPVWPGTSEGIRGLSRRWMGERESPPAPSKHWKGAESWSHPDAESLADKQSASGQKDAAGIVMDMERIRQDERKNVRDNAVKQYVADRQLDVAAENKD